MEKMTMSEREVVQNIIRELVNKVRLKSEISYIDYQRLMKLIEKL